MDLLRLRTVSLLLLAGCAAYVTANEYGGAIYAYNYAYNYARSQLYDAMVQPSLGYLGSKPIGGLSSGLQVDSGVPDLFLLSSLLSFLIKLCKYKIRSDSLMNPSENGLLKLRYKSIFSFDYTQAFYWILILISFSFGSSAYFDHLSHGLCHTTVVYLEIDVTTKNRVGEEFQEIVKDWSTTCLYFLYSVHLKSFENNKFKNLVNT